MAVDKLVDSSQLDTDLTSVANAIRTKGGTSASLAFPADFVSAIGAIPTGGGGSNAATGTVTVATQINMLTIDTGISNANYFCMFLESCQGSFPGYKSFSILCSDFTRWVALGTNNAGTAGSYQSGPNASANGKVEVSGTSVTITGAAGTGAKIGEIQPGTWVWFAG